jgi:hypothetical protein
MMAVRKVTRPNPPAQPKPDAKPTRRHANQLKAEMFEYLRNLNRGYGAALTALYRLEMLDNRQAFPAGCLNGYRNRTEALRAQANGDLLRRIAGREDHEAERFGRLCNSPEKPSHNRQSS